MLNTLVTILEFILAFGVLVFIHEFGHFIVARLSGIEVEEFGFGYPPRIGKIFRFAGTDFTLNWIPFGGFCRMWVPAARWFSASKMNGERVHLSIRSSVSCLPNKTYLKQASEVYCSRISSTAPFLGRINSSVRSCSFCCNWMR